MSLGVFLSLLFCNVLWSGVYASSKLLFARYSATEIAFLRFVIAGLPPLIYCAFKRDSKTGHTLLGAWARDVRPLDFRILAVGALTFFVTPLTQLTGLKLSRAIDGAVMIAIEPLVTVFAACLLLRERLRPVQLAALALAVVGASVLSEVTFSKLLAFSDARLIGNSIFVISALSEAAYSVLAKPVLDRRPPVLFFTLAIWTGIALLFARNLAIDGGAHMSGLKTLFQEGTATDWLILLYLGLGASLFGYLYWMVLLRRVPLSAMAITLYFQPVLGVAWGTLLVHESATMSTFVGGALILVAVWLASRPPRRS